MQRTAAFFKVLGDETRLKMLLMLFNHQELCVCDFMEALRITQSKASRHLRTLYHAGLVKDRREGTWSYYTLLRSDDDLIREQLAALEESLASRQGTTELLDELALWLSKKDRSELSGRRPSEARTEVLSRIRRSGVEIERHTP